MKVYLVAGNNANSGIKIQTMRTISTFEQIASIILDHFEKHGSRYQNLEEYVKKDYFPYRRIYEFDMDADSPPIKLTGARIWKKMVTIESLAPRVAKGLLKTRA
jgi:hypothetical protein